MRKTYRLKAILILGLLGLCHSCGSDDIPESISKTVKFDSIQFCLNPNVDGKCIEDKSQIQEGAVKIYSSLGANLQKSGGKFSFNWFFVDTSGCRTLLSKAPLSTDHDGNQVLTAFLENIDGFKKGTYELEVLFDGNLGNPVSAQFLVH